MPQCEVLISQRVVNTTRPDLPIYPTHTTVNDFKLHVYKFTSEA